MRRARPFAVGALCVVCSLSTGCKKLRGGRGGLPPAPPPIEAYKLGVFTTAKGQPIPAPASAVHPWRVLMLQEKPRPKKNPRWQPIPADQSGFIEMPAGSRWKCLYNPVEARPDGDEYLKSVERWSLYRAVRCSSDGWNTYSQAVQRVTLSPEGQVLETTASQTELYLHDRINGKPVEITIVLRSD